MPQTDVSSSNFPSVESTNQLVNGFEQFLNLNSLVASGTEAVLSALTSQPDLGQDITSAIKQEIKDTRYLRRRTHPGGWVTCICLVDGERPYLEVGHTADNARVQVLGYELSRSPFVPIPTVETFHGQEPEVVLRISLARD